MRINVLQKGDSVINVTDSFIAIRRKNGEVEIIPYETETYGLRLNQERKIVIGYGDGTVVTEDSSGITIANF